jgi:hypothetical protein
MQITLSLIGGCMCGFEYVYDDDSELNHVVVDLFIVRLMFTWEKS